ncbi:TPA: hypothetical protein DGH83_00085 [Candidatus Peregrinibacteria bacterium]|nr:hypothetical protein [Candidatus Peregrinibacteria bacterium]
MTALTSLFGGCSLFQDEKAVPVIPDGKGETPVAVDLLNPEIAPYFQTGDIQYTGIVQLDRETFLAPYKDDLFKIYSEGMLGGNPNSTTAAQFSWETNLAPFFHWYEVGTIFTKGLPYEGQKLVVLNLDCEGPCFSPNLYRFAWDEATQTLTFLAPYSTEYYPDYLSPLMTKKDEQIVLAGLTLPEQIELPDGKGVLTLSHRDKSYLADPFRNVTFKDPSIGDVYFPGTSENPSNLGCFYVQAPDGSHSQYDYNPGFFAENQTTWLTLGATPPDIGFPMRVNLSETYSYTVSGCGIDGNCYFLVTADVNNLEKVGQTDSGVDLYVVKNPIEATVNVPLTPEQEVFAQSYQTYRDMYQWKVDNEGYTLLTFDQYVDANPILYWQDPLGRWSTLSHKDFKPLAECGKPVIYLYPQETTDVSVQVGVTSFSKTVPAYGENGWMVQASPDGTLLNYADGQTYPYLFWEGQGKPSVSPDQGFVIAREDLATFLDSSLDKLGFLTQEKADFVDFWLPRMLKNKQAYFFISFLGTQEMNAIAPLTVTPAPTTMSRILMFYHPTDSYLSIPTQTLSPVMRRGFTLFEWGGTSSRPWQE